MAGPAGGRGGGHRGGGGGSFGGGGHRGGGGFGGGHHGGFHGGYHGGFGRGPRRPFFGFYRRPYGYYYGGGLVGGLVSIILVPIIITIIALMFLVANIISTVSIINNGGEVVYDEEAFQDYANANYYAHFSDPTTEEDGIMIIILTYEDNQELAYAAWVGDNVSTSVNDLFGTDDEFGYYLESTINIDNYKYSLSKDISKIMDYMATEVSYLSGSNFVENHDMSGAPKSALINRSGLDMNKNTVESALDRFTEETDIPAAVLVDTAENVFGKSMPTGNIILAVITVAIIAICVFSIVKNVKTNKKMKNNFKVNEPNQTRNENGTDYSGLDRDTFN